MSTTTPPPPPPYVPNDIFAHYGRQLIKNFWENASAPILPTSPGPQAGGSAAAAPPSYSMATMSSRILAPAAAAGTTPTPTVGILGAGTTYMSPATSQSFNVYFAGIGGLYVALILDDLGIPYKIIEGRERVGGRLYTYTFRNKTGAPYNYFDVGAMRFPQIPSMRRVFRLFDYGPLNTGDLALKAKVQPFYFVGGANNDTFLSYNNVTVKQNAVPPRIPRSFQCVCRNPGCHSDAIHYSGR